MTTNPERMDLNDPQYQQTMIAHKCELSRKVENQGIAVFGPIGLAERAEIIKIASGKDIRIAITFCPYCGKKLTCK